MTESSPPSPKARRSFKQLIRMLVLMLGVIAVLLVIEFQRPARKPTVVPPPQKVASRNAAKRVAKLAWSKVHIEAEPDLFLEQFQSVPPESGYLFAATWCQSLVRTSGFDQFFADPTGILAPEALTAFREIGLNELATILDEAMAKLGTPYPRDRKERMRRLGKVQGQPVGKRQDWDRFYELDRRFNAWFQDNPEGFDRAADEYASRFEQ